MFTSNEFITYLLIKMKIKKRVPESKRMSLIILIILIEFINISSLKILILINSILLNKYMKKCFIKM